MSERERRRNKRKKFQAKKALKAGRHYNPQAVNPMLLIMSALATGQYNVVVEENKENQ